MIKRFNYHQSPAERVLAALPLPVLTAHVRGPLAAAGAAACIVACLCSLDTHRLAALDREFTAVQQQVLASDAHAARAGRLVKSVNRLRLIEEHVEDARRDVVRATNTIARIGNGLPPQTWLTNIASTGAGDWTIAGRSTRVDEIGTMLRRVQGIDGHAAARLVSIASSGRSGRVLDFVIGWSPRT